MIRKCIDCKKKFQCEDICCKIKNCRCQRCFIKKFDRNADACFPPRKDWRIANVSLSKL